VNTSISAVLLLNVFPSKPLPDSTQAEAFFI
jgi:hypothetical protein